MDLHYVCELTEKFGYGGRVNVGHVTKMSVAAPEMPKYPNALPNGFTVLPATDLFLMSRDQDPGYVAKPPHSRRRDVRSPSTTFSHAFGDGSLMRMANMYANIAQASKNRNCFDMTSFQSARMMS